MKPLSERIKEFDNAQFVDWLCLACVDVREVRTPDDAQEEINKIRDAVTARLTVLDAKRSEAEHRLQLVRLQRDKLAERFIAAIEEEQDQVWASRSLDAKDCVEVIRVTLANIKGAENV